MVFALSFLLNLLPVTIKWYDKLGPFKSVALIVRTMAAGVQQSPAVPAQFWNEAERERAIDSLTGDTDIDRSVASSRARVRHLCTARYER